jgi:hypothetical protein
VEAEARVRTPRLVGLRLGEMLRLEAMAPREVVVAVLAAGRSNRSSSTG